jgi:(E)-4-hydroxy-3-methylbut-2-enyl-diphosphate synthase
MGTGTASNGATEPETGTGTASDGATEPETGTGTASDEATEPETDMTAFDKMRNTRQVNCGGVPIGGGAPVSIQSMTNTDTRDAAATAAQIERLYEAGCDIVRCSVPDETAATSLRDIRRILSDKGIRIPLVADIHFDYRLAISSIENGADKIRINPGNIGGDDKLREVVRAAKAAGIPIRIGVNGGSLEKDLSEQFGPTREALILSALRNIEKIRCMDFEDIVVSVKSSDVPDTIAIGRALAYTTDCPLHIGVTEAGTGARAIVKSAVGIGSLLAEGIGDTIRVSLTGDPAPGEVDAARDILASVGLLPGQIDVVSCPTCGRCRVDLAVIADEVDKMVRGIERARKRSAQAAHAMTYSAMAAHAMTDSVRSDTERSQQYPKLTVAIMGCAVNGPGEASHADLGVACGAGDALYFENGAPIKKIRESEIIRTLKEAIEMRVGMVAGQ